MNAAHAHAANGATKFIKIKNANSEYPSQPITMKDKPTARPGANLEYRIFSPA
jgi:hypothetical protein